MSTMIHVKALTKTYDNDYKALKSIDLEVEEGEILALLGPNGAGKTTLISTICGLVNPSSGSVEVGGYDIIDDYRKTRALIGLVPQELHTEAFETVWATVNFTRGLFGKKPNKAYIETILKDLSLWDKKDTPIMFLSGGMKRRLLIAKALCHEPRVLFLDEPTAGVDVELRRDMWRIVENLRQSGVTIILTTHYIEEAEEIADRVAIINQGEIKLIEEKETLMSRLGQKRLILELKSPLHELPESLIDHNFAIAQDGHQLICQLGMDDASLGQVMADLAKAEIDFTDLATEQSSLEDIFVDLIKEAS